MEKVFEVKVRFHYLKHKQGYCCYNAGPILMPTCPQWKSDRDCIFEIKKRFNDPGMAYFQQINSHSYFKIKDPKSDTLFDLRGSIWPDISPEFKSGEWCFVEQGDYYGAETAESLKQLLINSEVANSHLCSLNEHMEKLSQEVAANNRLMLEMMKTITKTT